MTCAGVRHALRVVSRQQFRVARATCSAELLGGCGVVDGGIVCAQLLHNVRAGDVCVTIARDNRDFGEYAQPMVASIDALSVFAVQTS
eukprot:5490846-Lingulodinium_polyedra.AAC.1